jgi:hypothetical protein
VFEAYTYNTGNTRTFIIFGREDGTNMNSAYLSCTGDLIRFTEDEPGNGQFGSSSITTPPVDAWILMRVSWHDGTGSEPDNTLEMSVWTVDGNFDADTELGSTTGLASDPNNGDGIGFSDNNSSSTTSWTDDLQIVGHVSD